VSLKLKLLCNVFWQRELEGARKLETEIINPFPLKYKYVENIADTLHV